MMRFVERMDSEKVRKNFSKHFKFPKPSSEYQNKADDQVVNYFISRGIKQLNELKLTYIDGNRIFVTEDFRKDIVECIAVVESTLISKLGGKRKVVMI